MPEKNNDRTIFSLAEVTLSIQNTLLSRYTTSFWIKAEMNRLHFHPQSGHCYPDLVEKREGKIVAEMKSTIWKEDYRRINTLFLDILHEPLKDGIKILFCAKVAFSPVYGLSLRIIEIDPSWSLGELEREKQETLDRLRKEGILGRNKALRLPRLPGRLAVISVDTSKGYADFRKIIDGNDWGYSVFYMLFPALLQGENAVHSIMEQLERVDRVKHHFDAVAIIRGGGGDIGLTCYNSYDLARAVALFSLPVFTGIGHSTNETVTEMVAARNAITPTELADFILQQYHNFSVPLAQARDTICRFAGQLIRDEKNRTNNMLRVFSSATATRLALGKNELQTAAAGLGHRCSLFLSKRLSKDTRENIVRLERGTGHMVTFQRRNLSILEGTLDATIAAFMAGRARETDMAAKSVMLLDPANVLSRGYSITLHNNRVIKSVDEVGKGAILETLLADGRIMSDITTVIKPGSHE